jgi:transposase
MSYVVEQKVGESIYLYEATSYWDPQKKQSRQKRIYLGKKDPTTGEAKRPRNPLPRHAKDYGNVYLLKEIAHRLGVSSIFQQVFPDQAATLLALIFFEISEGAPLYLFPAWGESTYLDEMRPILPSEITALTQQLGQMDGAQEEFFCQWAKRRRPIQTIVFDITSLSSYSTLINEVEWGYNRDHEHLPQVNPGIVYAQDERLPLYYQLYPGSIGDVSTLPNIVRYLEALNLSPHLFVMDRGFYSAANLTTMCQYVLPFLVPLPRRVTLFSQLLSQQTDTLTALSKSFLFQDEVLCHVQVATTLEALPLQAHLFFNPAQHQRQALQFLQRLWDAEAAVQTELSQPPQEIRVALNQQCSGATRFFRMTKTRTGQRKLYRNAQAITDHIAPLGATIFLTNQPDLDRTQILTLYRQKDFLEKTFDTLKHEIDGKRLRVHSAAALMGRIFLKFLSLVVYAGVTNTMRDQQMFTKYSVRELLYELKKLRIVELNNGKQVLTECSKRQREIFQAFDMEVPSLDTGSSLSKS